MQFSRKKKQLCIAVTDIFLLFLSVYFALFFRNLGHPEIPVLFPHIYAFLPIIIAWLVCLYTAGLYSLEMPYTGYTTLSKIFVISCISALLGIALYYLNYRSRIVPKTILALFSLFAFAFISLWRWIFYRISIKYFPGVNIAFIGINNTVIELLHNIKNFSYMRYNVPFIFDDMYDDNECCGIPVIKTNEEFIGAITGNKIKVVVLAYEKNISYIFQKILFELMNKRVYFVNIPYFYEIYLRLVPIDAVNELWFLKNIDLSVKRLYQYVKRFVDIIMTVSLLLASLPFWPFIILIIKLESSGPAFFIQKRIGYLGKEFSIIKFRSMRLSGNDYTPTDRQDPRVTGFGLFLRKSRIDEIPQLLNVLKGEMSFIGPRPERPEFVEELEHVVPFYRQRLLVKPGISGWDQVSGEYHSPSREDTYKKLQYDLYYIKNMSLFLDISIFFKTLVTIFSRAGV
jgi:exopolysaccharide biosynthesis polyprenyl glycosylphosphotransferase